MNDPRPTWKLVIEAATDLTRRGHTPFELRTLLQEVQRLDPSRGRESIQPTIQGLTVNAETGPASKGGKPLLRVAHGFYELREAEIRAAQESKLGHSQAPELGRLSSPRAKAVAPIEATLDNVAGEMTALIDEGLEHLLTEDILRFIIIRSLMAGGVPASTIRTEVRIQDVGAIDLVFGDDVTTAMELKYPRDPTNFGAADTMTLGELIKDFYKVVHAVVDFAFVIQMTDERLRRYLLRRVSPEPEWSFDPGTSMTFTSEAIQSLPNTAKNLSLIKLSEHGDVVAECFWAQRFHSWMLVAWSVSNLQAPA